MQIFSPSDTIAAISTPPGSGALGIIRISGSQSIQVGAKLIQTSRKLNEVKGYTLLFGKFMNGEDLLDEVLVSVFHAPHSYTGEDSLEISFHGSPYILQKALELIIQQGVRMATPGEFTQRAFLHGKMDLSQAEAVSDLIAAESKAAHRLALNQMKGGFSNEIRELREHLINFASLIELELDFAEEDVEFANRNELIKLVSEILVKVTSLADSFQTGNAIRNGIQVAIAGKPNAGKSSWINALVNDEVAIVSDIAGTTRDKIEVPVTIHGVLFRLIDTAGLRATDDVIEGIGIKKAEEVISKASIVMYLMDAQTISNDEIEQAVRHIRSLNEEGEILLLANKADTIHEGWTAFAREYGHWDMHTVSVRDTSSIKWVKDALIQRAHLTQWNMSSVIVTNVRHYDALKKTEVLLTKVLEDISEKVSGDLLAMDIRQALYHLGEIIGEVTADDLLGNIFSKFCIGK